MERKGKTMNQKEYVAPDLTVHRFTVTTDLMGWPDGSGMDPWATFVQPNAKNAPKQPFVK